MKGKKARSIFKHILLISVLLLMMVQVYGRQHTDGPIFGGPDACPAYEPSDEDTTSLEEVRYRSIGEQVETIQPVVGVPSYNYYDYYFAASKIEGNGIYRPTQDAVELIVPQLFGQLDPDKISIGYLTFNENLGSSGKYVFATSDTAYYFDPTDLINPSTVQPWEVS